MLADGQVGGIGVNRRSGSGVIAAGGNSTGENLMHAPSALVRAGMALALWLTAIGHGAALGAPPEETKKIEALISHVEGLKDAKFVRNGIEYDAKTAGAFLRGKWDTNKAKIKTASDFIEQVATKSSTTGKPYLIRLKDGQEHKSGEYLAEQLKLLKSRFQSQTGGLTPLCFPRACPTSHASAHRPAGPTWSFTPAWPAGWKSRRM